MASYESVTLYLAALNISIDQVGLILGNVVIQHSKVEASMIAHDCLEEAMSCVFSFDNVLVAPILNLLLTRQRGFV